MKLTNTPESANQQASSSPKLNSTVSGIKAGIRAVLIGSVLGFAGCANAPHPQPKHPDFHPEAYLSSLLPEYRGNYLDEPAEAPRMDHLEVQPVVPADYREPEQAKIVPTSPKRPYFSSESLAIPASFSTLLKEAISSVNSAETPEPHFKKTESIDPTPQKTVTPHMTVDQPASPQAQEKLVEVHDPVTQRIVSAYIALMCAAGTALGVYLTKSFKDMARINKALK